MAGDAEIVACELRRLADRLHERGEMLERRGIRITQFAERSPALMFALSEMFRETADGIARRVARESD